MAHEKNVLFSDQDISNESTILKFVMLKPYLLCKNILKTRLSYYNVTTGLVDLVGLCRLKQNLSGKNMLG